MWQEAIAGEHRRDGSEQNELSRVQHAGNVSRAHACGTPILTVVENNSACRCCHEAFGVRVPARARKNEMSADRLQAVVAVARGRIEAGAAHWFGRDAPLRARFLSPMHDEDHQGRKETTLPPKSVA